MCAAGDACHACLVGEVDSGGTDPLAESLDVGTAVPDQVVALVRGGGVTGQMCHRDTDLPDL